MWDVGCTCWAGWQSLYPWRRPGRPLYLRGGGAEDQSRRYDTDTRRESRQTTVTILVQNNLTIMSGHVTVSHTNVVSDCLLTVLSPGLEGRPSSHCWRLTQHDIYIGGTRLDCAQCACHHTLIYYYSFLTVANTSCYLTVIRSSLKEGTASTLSVLKMMRGTKLLNGKAEFSHCSWSSLCLNTVFIYLENKYFLLWLLLPGCFMVDGYLWWEPRRPTI